MSWWGWAIVSVKHERTLPAPPFCIPKESNDMIQNTEFSLSISVGPDADLHDVARAACELTADPSEATDLMFDWARRNPVHFDQLKNQVMSMAFNAAIHKAYGKIREVSKDHMRNGNSSVLSRERFEGDGRFDGSANESEPKSKPKKDKSRKGKETASKLNRTAIRNTRNEQAFIGIFAWQYDGRYLGDFTRVELLDTADRQERNCRGHLAVALFMRQVASGLSGRQKVHNRYSLGDLESIWKKSKARADKMNLA